MADVPEVRITRAYWQAFWEEVYGRLENQAKLKVCWCWYEEAADICTQ